MREGGRELSVGGVKGVRQHAIEAEVGHIGEVIVGGEFDPVGVRGFLALFVGAENASVLDNGSVFTEFAVGEDWEDDYVAGSVIGDEEIFAGFVEEEIAGIFAESRKFVQERELGGFGVNGEGTDGALLSGFVRGVGPFAVGMDHDPGGIGCFGGEAFGSELAAGGIKFVRVDAFAVGVVGVGADENEEFLVRRLRKGRKNRQQTRENEEKAAARDFHGLVV